MRLTSLTPVASLAAVSLLLVGCGSHVPSEEIETTMSDELESTYGVEVEDATCDDNLDAEEGEEVTCTVTVEGEETEVLVTADSVDGDEVYMTFEPQE